MSLLPRLDRPLSIPAPFCPIPPVVPAAGAEALQWRSNEWMRHSGMYGDPTQRDRLERVNVGYLTAHGVPDGLPDRTQVVSDVVMWLFAVDDYCDETDMARRPAAYAAFATQVQRAVEAPEVAAFDGNPYVAGARDLRLRLESSGATTWQMMRWAYGIRMFLFGQVRESHARALRERPDLTDFMALRLDTAGVLPVYALIDYARGIELPGTQVNHPTVRALTEMAIMLIALDDEIVSFHKECHRSPDDLNIIGLLAHHQNLAPAQALAEAIMIRDKVMARFFQLGGIVAARADKTLAAYITGLGTWVRAWMDWSYDVDRYVNPDAPADLTGGCFDRKPAHSDESLANPAIAWWWDSLPTAAPHRL